ncbi:MAG TPA: potassium channel family protein [Methylomirabilota bacterium]|nr:potassium channel family protein [Methylomirabilota bacterium]
MKALAGAAGLLLIFGILWEAFETIVLPRRVARRVRLTRLFYRSTWIPWSGVARRALRGQRRETFLGFYGPLSLLVLLTVWAFGLVLGFALLLWASGSAIQAAEGMSPFGADLYLSGTTFFTLGLGDVTPRSAVARALTVIEAGTGFGFLALVIGYLPVLYQSFSRREVNVSLLDARAGSPPSAVELLRRHAAPEGQDALRELLREWERWSAELLETHLSYPVLAYFRSQHDNQSWLAALTTILDVSALVMAGIETGCQREAQLTFAMARHAIGDLAQVFRTAPLRAMPDRLPPPKLAQLRESLEAAGLKLRQGPTADQEFAELRGLYEPYVAALAGYLRLGIPDWLADAGRADNWQTTAWGQSSGPGFPAHLASDEHRKRAGESGRRA